MSDTVYAAALKTTAEGEQLVRSYKHCLSEVDQLQRRLNEARGNLRDASTALGKWILPPDAKQGECIAVWWVDSLIQAKVLGEGAVEVTLRYRGRKWSMP